MTAHEAYIAFNLTDNIGSVGVEALVERFGDPVAAWEAYPKKISRTGGEVDWRGEIAAARKHGVTLLTCADEGYPAILCSAPGRPLVLYVKGSVAALSTPAIAIVGTRRATAYGREQANRFGYELAKCGWSVISGLALGIDAEAHRGALDAGGVTVGIIGSGLDRFYPEENRALAREIVEKGGAVVSEFPFGRAPDQQTFPIRNHVVAALARGTVAIEAPVKSGTLITTGIAADLGRIVMALPGRVDARTSAGCLKLIRDGATLVRCASDVNEAMGSLLPQNVKTAAPAADEVRAEPVLPALSVEEALVLRAADPAGMSIDELVRTTKLSVAKVNSLVMQLRLKDRLRFLPGNRVAPNRG